jgi:hypothetical protein
MCLSLTERPLRKEAAKRTEESRSVFKTGFLGFHRINAVSRFSRSWSGFPALCLIQLWIIQDGLSGQKRSKTVTTVTPIYQRATKVFLSGLRRSSAWLIIVFLMANSHESPQPTRIQQLSVRKTYVPSTECLAILGITSQTFCLWVRQGKLQALRIGGRYVVDPTTLAVFLRSRQM